MWEKRESEADQPAPDVPPAGAVKPAERRQRDEQPLDLEKLLGIAPPGASMSILDFWYLLRERWLTGLLAGIVLGSLTAFLILRQPALYESVIQFDLKSDDKVFNPLFDTQGDRELQAHVTKVTSQNFFDHLAGRILLNPQL
ncbi:MAG: hypothetical protein ACO3J2_10265, partial [Chthoniobacterales bacterium]